MANDSNTKVGTAIKALCDEVRGGKITGVTTEILQTLLREDPKLQQAFWSAILRAQIRYASAPVVVTNEKAVELAKDVKDLAIKKGLDFGLPYV